MGVDETLNEQQFKELIEIIYHKVQESEILRIEDLIEEIKHQFYIRKSL
jgi:hypothetical protein